MRLLLLGLLFSVPQDQPARKPKLDATYSHPFFAFKIYLPSKWTRGPNHGKAQVSFYGPKEVAYTPRIDLFIERNASELPDLATKYKAAFRKAYPEVTFAREEAASVRKKDVYQFEALFTEGDVEMQALWTLVSVMDRKYILSFNCTKAWYDKYRAAADAAMKSLRVFAEPAASPEDRQAFLNHYHKGYDLQRGGKTDEAIKEFQAASKLLPAFADVHTILAMLYRTKSNFVESEKSYRKGVELDPDDFDGQFSLGTILLQQSKYDEAIRFLEKSAELEPDREAPYTNLGVAYLGKEATAKAKEVLLKAVEHDPESAPAHYNLGMCYEKSGDLKGAESEFKDTLQMDPAHKGAKEGLARLQKK